MAHMPLDRTCLPDSPLARLLEADRKLTTQRRAAVKASHPPESSEQKQARRVAQARESVIALDRLAELFAGGQHWIQDDFEDGKGGYCLVGGLRHIRAGRASGDRAGVYLSRAVESSVGMRMSLIRFNDGRCSNHVNHRRFADIRRVIERARELALQDAGGAGEKRHIPCPSAPARHRPA